MACAAAVRASLSRSSRDDASTASICCIMLRLCSCSLSDAVAWSGWHEASTTHSFVARIRAEPSSGVTNSLCVSRPSFAGVTHSFSSHAPSAGSMSSIMQARTFSMLKKDLVGWAQLGLILVSVGCTRIGTSLGRDCGRVESPMSLGWRASSSLWVASPASLSWSSAVACWASRAAAS